MPTEKPFSPDPEKTMARTDGSVERQSKTVRISRHALNPISLSSVGYNYVFDVLFQEGVHVAWPIDLNVSDPWLWYSDLEVFIFFV